MDSLTQTRAVEFVERGKSYTFKENSPRFKLWAYVDRYVTHEIHLYYLCPQIHILFIIDEKHEEKSYLS